MARRPTFWKGAKLVASANLIGLGVLTLHGHLERAATRVNDLFCNPAGGLGLAPTAILVASRVLPACTVGYKRFLMGLLLRILESFWPLLLGVVGTALAGDAFAGGDDAPTKKVCEPVDPASGRSTLK